MIFTPALLHMHKGDLLAGGLGDGDPHSGVAIASDSGECRWGGNQLLRGVAVPVDGDGRDYLVTHAYEAARSARFEFGQRG